MQMRAAGANLRLDFGLLCAHDHVCQTRRHFRADQFSSGSRAARERRMGRGRAARHIVQSDMTGSTWHAPSEGLETPLRHRLAPLAICRGEA